MLKAGNTRLKEMRRLSRRSERSERRLFLAEGPNAFEAALAAGCVLEVFARPGDGHALPEIPDGIRVTWVDERALASLSDAVAPAGVVALCRFVDVPAEEALTGRLVALCADVRDPGNAGTVVRCADAAGAAGVVLAGNSVDLYNPKTLRSSAGSAFQLPIALEKDPIAVVEAARAAGFTVLAADGAGEVDLFAADHLLGGPVAWLFGNEAWGLPRHLAGLADHRVAIPIFGKAESLNLATAAALCLYTSARVGRA